MTSQSITPKSSFDGLNLAEASLISCLTRLPEGETSWEHSFIIAGREMHVECLGNAYGYPHGPDNDMMLILINLYFEHGKPKDRTLSCTAYSLLKMLDRTDSSQNYRIIHDSLTRLAGTLYKVSGWLDHPGGTARRVTFRFIERVEETQGEAVKLNLKNFGSGTKLKIVLDAEVAASLNSSRVRPFDLDFMLKLSSTQCRLLFRLLDTYWYTDGEAAARGYLEFGVLELGRLLRLNNMRLDSVRRTLNQNNKELIESGFLSATELIGRGAQQRIRYVINPQRPDYPLTAEQLEIVGRIKTLDIPDAKARDYVRKHSLEVAWERVRLAEQIIAKTTSFRKGKSAYAWDILTDRQGKYAAPMQGSTTKSPPKTKTPTRPKKEVEDAHVAFEEAQRAKASLPPAEQWKEHLPALKFHFKKHLTPVQWNALESQCKVGILLASEVVQEYMQALSRLQADEFRHDLKRKLDADLL